MTNRWEHFSEDELACSHCMERGVTQDAGDKLQVLRRLMNQPLFINSAYRCTEHNLNVGGAPASKHMEGIAFDVSLRNVEDKEKLLSKAKQAGFTGFGLYGNFLHVDTGPTRTWGEW